MRESIVIVSGCRTAVGKFSGLLKNMEASDLGGAAIKEAVKRAGLSPKAIDEVVYGCVGQAAENAFAARLASVKAGIPYEATALTVNRLCSSGLQAIVTAAQEIRDGMCEIAVAGGCESMTNIPYYLRKARSGYRMGHGELEDGLITALSDPFTRNHMGITAENVAEKYNISRDDQDRWAAISQQRAEKAQKEGKFKDEIVPLEIKLNKKETVIFDQDEHIRPGTTKESLSKLRPAFKADGSVTAGNAAGINDAAAAVVMMKESKAKELGIKPLVRLVEAAVAGVDPSIMGIGPVPAFQKLLEKTGVKKEEIGLIELNEAFAAQAVACMRELDLDENIVNVNGSGISLGHPIGATGCIITIKLINEMMRRKVKYGAATLCIGGGQGIAVLFQLCS
ncbi:MAG: acetyl-CoA C-acetyltransferase [Lachnoclostridium edouardi]|uniref:thiolase family protein n=1 Tax=Lachnoclostridium edouardi TaxID=1926283 RepID=UPI0026DD27F9|nr:acetyl-CoA C-acetyltransferase [Lachnoclostridium edouardi]MDO4279203.1 acetyl-CoA C-acetyltransferase [Lachnoclostridium edouardi]